MKWGIRRTPEQLGHKRKSKKSSKKVDTRSKDRKEVDELLGKGVKSLSDAELNRVLNRLSAEDRFAQMTKPKVQQNQKKGNSWVKKTLAATGALASAAISRALFKQGEQWTKEFMEGFARGYARASVDAEVAREAARKMTQLAVRHDDITELELYHYGVKGMKWGVRKQREKKPLTARQKQKAEYKQYKKLRKKRSSKLSVDELRTVVERDELEWKRKKYSKYVKPGENYAKKFLVSTGSKLIGDAVLIGAAYVGAKYVEKQVKGALSDLAVKPGIKTGVSAAKAAAELAKDVKKATPRVKFKLR